MKIVKIIAGIIVTAGLLFLLGFTNTSNNLVPVNELNITVDHKNGMNFIESQEIKSLVKKHLLNKERNPFRNGLLREIEELVSELPHVDKAEVYRTIDGNIHIRTTQRQPLLRVINSHNESYYLDHNGRMMPLSGNYSARVLIATGHINALYSPVVDLRKANTKKENFPERKKLQELFELAEYIDSHNFWRYMIDHIYVTASGEFELTPKNAAHVIEFGRTEAMEEKFRKLYVFYRYGLTQVGWNHYRRVNLKFSNQIICSK
jgi:cell division protein FtsQ